MTSTEKGCYYLTAKDYQESIVRNNKTIEVLKRAKREILLSSAKSSERYAIPETPNPMETIEEIEKLLSELIS